MKKKSGVLNTILLVCLCLMASMVVAEPDVTPTLKDIAEKQDADDAVFKELSKAKATGPYDEYNRSTPRSSLLALAQAVKNKDYEKAANYLDLRNLPFSGEEKLDGADLARKLHIIARRGMSIDFESMSADPRGNTDDGLPSYRDRIASIQTRNGPEDILLQRVPRGDGEFVWKISNATVAKIPELYKEFGYGVIGERLSQFFPHYVIKGFEAWQLVMLLVLFFVGYLVAYLLTYIAVTLLQKNQRFNKERLKKFIVGPLRFLITVLIFRASFDMIAPSLVARALFEAKTLLIIAILWILLGVIDLIMLRFADRMKRNGQQDAVVLLKPASTGIKLVVALFAVISWMDNLGYQVTTILAGLGVGGVAVALAAQKSLENLIGSITIYASQPVHVGDFCKFEDTIGTVEEIGLRSTQLRTLARTVVHIPNALFSSGKIENLTQRDKILYRTRLRLSYEVTPQQLTQVLEAVRHLIADTEFIDVDASRVRFVEFSEYAQELELFIYIRTQDFAQYLEYIEQINLQLNRIIDEAGVKLVVPTNRTYLETTTADALS